MIEGQAPMCNRADMKPRLFVKGVRRLNLSAGVTG